MAKPKTPFPLGKTETIKGLSEKSALDKFLYNLRNNFSAQQTTDRGQGQYVLAHERINADGDDIDVIVYSSSKVYITASSKMNPTKFNGIASTIVESARKSTTTIKKKRALQLQRVDTIVSFISSINLGDEGHRMIAVVLADTSNEIVITEYMKNLQIQGPPLEDNLPNKIKYLQNKGENVYREDDIRQVRTVRNAVVHQGSIPDKKQAQAAIDISKDILSHA